MTDPTEEKRRKIRPNSEFEPLSMALSRWEKEIIQSYIRHWSRENSTDLASQLRSLDRRWRSIGQMRRVCAVCLVLADLLDQDWLIRADGGEIFAIPSELRRDMEFDPEHHKARLRKTLRKGRDRQIREPSVRGFLNSMERGGSASVLRLVDDGADLWRAINDTTKTEEALSEIVVPEVTICTRDVIDDVTGLNSLDIWRYFRHTWSLEYRSTPGRTLPVIFRNKARRNRPVIGIALLASPVMRLKQRDNWFGWSAQAWKARLLFPSISANAWCAEFRETLDRAIDYIRYDDLISEASLRQPTKDDILLLERRAAGADALRSRLLEEVHAGSESQYLSKGAVKEALPDTDWVKASSDPLFVKKRTENLAKLLDARRAIIDAGALSLGKDDLYAFLSTQEGERALATVAKEQLKTSVSSQLMDVAICGAIAPYNQLISGKLITLLLTSKEVQEAYRSRYAGQASIIASQMAGRPIVKTSELKSLTTSSLYGNAGSSQYSRLKILSNVHPELTEDVVWSRIGKTQGFGSVHLSNATVESLRDASVDFHGARRINSRFGEGTNPRMRQIREGLEALGVDSDRVLAHSTPRILYGCNLPSKNTMDDITAAWIRRWLVSRVQRTDFKERLEGLGPHTVAEELARDDEGQYVLPLEMASSKKKASAATQ